jgi:hypothetical protein
LGHSKDDFIPVACKSVQQEPAVHVKLSSIDAVSKLDSIIFIYGSFGIFEIDFESYITIAKLLKIPIVELDG